MNKENMKKMHHVTKGGVYKLTVPWPMPPQPKKKEPENDGQD